MLFRKSFSLLIRFAKCSVVSGQSFTGAARHARSFSSWSTSNEETFEQTAQALIRDISYRKTENVKTVVPWFHENMPVRSV